ncbi:MAG TPA: hypothetical protein VI386_15420 [Candidatus Sulfotelmatobacter sp.]
MHPASHPAARLRLSFVLSMLASLVALMAPTLNHAQGFGTIKEKVQLHRKLPAVAHLGGSSFTVKATSHSPSGKEVADLLPDMLETELLKNEKTLRADKDAPAVTISCVITNYETPPHQTVTRNESVLQKGKLVQKPKTYIEITGQLDVTYKVTDKSGKTIDSNNPSAKYAREFEQKTNQASDQSSSVWSHLPSHIPKLPGHGDQAEAPAVQPTSDQLRQELIHQIVSQIAPRLVNTDESVEVLLAGGKLGDANKIAQKGQWNRYLEALETMTPLGKPEDDAYRLYDIGVANEAMGYQSEDRTAAKKFFEEAAINYGKAIEAKPGEKYFLDPQTRVETAVTYYKELGQTAVNAAKVDKEPMPSGGQTASGALNNQKVIEMFKSGVDEDSILAEIKQAAKVDFKLGADDLIQLANNGIKGKIPAAMRERMHPAKTATTHK